MRSKCFLGSSLFFFFLIWGLFDLILFPSSLRCHGSRFSSTSKGFASSHSERQGVKSQKQTQRQTRCRCLENPRLSPLRVPGGQEDKAGAGVPCGGAGAMPRAQERGKKEAGGGGEWRRRIFPPSCYRKAEGWGVPALPG